MKQAGWRDPRLNGGRETGDMDISAFTSGVFRLGSRVARLGPGVLIPAGLVLGILAVTLGLWLARIPLAEWAVRDWCTRQAMTCEVSLARLDPARVNIASLTITREGGQPVQLTDAVADITWPGLLRPEVTGVSLGGGKVRARYGEAGFDLYGLETLVPEQRDTAPVAMPSLNIPSLQIEIETSAGVVAAQLTAIGTFPEDFRVELNAQPVDLSRQGDRLALTEGFFKAHIVNGVPVAEGAMRLSRAEIDGLVAENVVVNLASTMQTAPTGPPTHQFTLAGSTGPVALGARRAALLRFESRGVMAPSQPERAEAWLSGLSAMSVSAELLELDSPEMVADRVLLDTRLEGSTGALNGPVLLSLEGVVTAQASLRRANITGNTAIGFSDTALRTVSFDGGVVGEGLSLNALLRMALTSPLRAGDPLQAHASAAREALSGALSDFTTGVDLQAQWTAESGLTLESRRASQLVAANGLRFSVTPASERPWLTLDAKALSLDGDLNASGAGLPDIAMGAARMSLPLTPDGALDLAASPFVVGDWAAGGLTVALDADAMSLSGATGQLRGEGLGEIRLDGSAFGLSLREAVVFGGVRAVEGAEGWRIVMQGTDCVAIRAKGALAGNLAIGPFSLSACPDEGRVLRREGDSLLGGASLSDVAFTARTPDLTAGLNLAAARADWTLKDGLVVRLSAAGLEAPIRIGAGDLLLRAKSPALGFDFTGRTPRLDASLQSARLSGSLVPAQVEAARLDFSGRVTRSGLDGAGRYSDVSVSDLVPNPNDALYQPLRLNGDYTLKAGLLAAKAGLTLAKSERAIASAALDLELATLDGTLILEGQRLEFRKKGLQPSELSDRVRGLFTDATGAVTPRADLAFRGGVLSGTGEVLIEGLSFQTFRLGSVTGVSGKVVFDDIVKVRTPPGQTLTLAEVNPGIPLRAGRLRFQLFGPTAARLEEAVWPFAGGQLVILPTDWNVQGSSDTVLAEMRQISLSDLVTLLKIPDLRIEGTASGTFPIVIRGGEVRISGATLKADETGGRLQYTGATAQTASEASADAGLTFQALRDFNFTVLEIGIDGNVAGNLTVTVLLLGRNPAVLDGRPFNITISVDSPLMRLLESGVRVFDPVGLAGQPQDTP